MNFQAALRRFDLEGWLSQWRPKVYGDERAVDCPVCSEDGKKEKLWVNIRKRMACCYFCESGYKLLDLVMLLEDCGLGRAIQVILKHAGSEDRDKKTLAKSVRLMIEQAEEEAEHEVEELPVMDLPEGFISYRKATKIPRYFREREINRPRALHYELGWCEGGFFNNRLIVPIYFGGELRGYHARWMKKTPPAGVKKVLYPKGQKSNLMLFNWDRAKNFSHIVLVEDPFSAMAVGDNGCALFGTRLSPQQLRLILSADIDHVTILLDRDATTEVKRKERTPKAYAMAQRLTSEGVRADVAVLPDDRDPDDLPAAELASVLASASDAGLGARLRAKLA